MTALAEKRNTLRLRWRETPEDLYKLVLHEGAAIVPYNDKMIMAGWYYNGPEAPGWYGAIYERLEDGPLHPEMDLGLACISAKFYEDEGHAIEWAINTIRKERRQKK